MKFVYTNSDTVNKMKKRAESDELFCNNLRENTEVLCLHDFSSIVNSPCLELSENPHDYCSQAPYWWPNPKNPNGPYIRRDGEYNPERFITHLELFRKTANEVVVLSQAGYYLNDTSFSDNAAKRLEVFFVDENTKMNPNMNHSQAIKGICDGRQIGIIDAVCMHEIIHSLDFLRLCGKYDDIVVEMEKWFLSFLNWLINGEFGKKEKVVGNNHSMWYAALVMAIASMLNKGDIVDEYADFYRNTLIYQINPAGEFIDEITRTKSFSYSLFNLNATATLCEIAFNCGIDIWNYETDDKRGIRSAVLYLLPYLRKQKPWPYLQISKNVSNESFAIELASKRLNIDTSGINEMLRDNKEYFYYCEPIGPLSLIFP